VLVSFQKQKQKLPEEPEADPNQITDPDANEVKKDETSQAQTQDPQEGTFSPPASDPSSPQQLSPVLTPSPTQTATLVTTAATTLPPAAAPATIPPVSVPSPKEFVSMTKTAEAVAKNQTLAFVPTEEWIRSWKRTLALGTIIRLLNILVPQIEKICVDRGIVSEDEVLKYLSSGTLVGLLPVPHPIMVRKYKPNHGTYAWATIFMWGVIYLRNLNPPIWFGTKVELFMVKKI